MKERIKTVLLGLLCLLTVYLTLRVWIYDEALLDTPALSWARAPLRTLLGFGSPSPSPAPADPIEPLEVCAWPVKVAVNHDGARIGAMYDARAAELFSRHTDLLREALGTALTPVRTSYQAWLRALEGDCVYMQYDTILPLRLLASWISGSCPLDAEVRTLAVCLSGDGVELWYQSETDGAYYRAQTMARPFSLSDGEATGVPCRFAFESPQALPNAPGDMLIMDVPAQYALVSSEPVDATMYADRFMQRLQMSDSRYHEEAGGARVYVDNLRTCSVSPDGGISYRSPDEESRPQLMNVAGDLSWEVEQAKRLLDTLSPALEDAVWALDGMEGGRYLFTVMVDGVPVSGGARAAVTFENGAVTAADIHLRRYGVTQETAPLLPVYHALLLLDGAQAPLGLCYPDAGDTLRAEWRVEA